MMTLRGKLNRSWILIPALALVLATGCAKKAKDTTEEEITPTTDMGVDNTLGDSDSGKASGLVTINFPYDSFALDSAAKEALKNNAAILKEKSTLNIQIEGHCDTRGGVQYNIALGERRANTVKKHLEGLGIAASRVSTISFGKEKLLDTAETEAAHARNRRANFVVTSR